MNEVSSVFPGGAAGAALLLLRLSLAFVIVADVASVVRLSLMALLLLPVAAALLMGAFTRLSGAVSALAFALWAALGGSIEAIAPHMIVAVALSLLGGGAYSMDCRLFGRSVVRLPW